MSRIPFTKLGYENLSKELIKLKAMRNQAVINLKNAREMGDLSENAAYRVARSKLSSLDFRLKKLQKILDAAYILERKNNESIDIGSLVKIEINNKVFTYLIVHTLEAQIGTNTLSTYSPLGKSLIGKNIGDKIKITTPSGDKNCKVLSIE